MLIFIELQPFPSIIMVSTGSQDERKSQSRFVSTQFGTGCCSVSFWQKAWTICSHQCQGRTNTLSAPDSRIRSESVQQSTCSVHLFAEWFQMQELWHWLHHMTRSVPFQLQPYLPVLDWFVRVGMAKVETLESYCQSCLQFAAFCGILR